MTKKRGTIRLDPQRLAVERIKMVSERKPDDTIRANGSGIVGTGHDKRGRGMEPVGMAIWRVINGLRRGIH